MVRVERGNRDESGIEGFGQAVVGVTHEVFRMWEAGVGVRGADAHPDDNRDVSFACLEGVHVEIVEDPAETARRAILHIGLDGDHGKHVRLRPGHDIERADELAHFGADTGHQLVNYTLFILFFDHAQIIDPDEQQASGAASGFSMFDGVGNPLQRELEIAEPGYRVHQIGGLQFAYFFPQELIGPQQLVLSAGDSLGGDHSWQ